MGVSCVHHSILVFNILFGTLWMPNSYLILLKTLNAPWHGQNFYLGPYVCGTKYLIII